MKIKQYHCCKCQTCKHRRYNAQVENASYRFDFASVKQVDNKITVKPTTARQ